MLLRAVTEDDAAAGQVQRTWALRRVGWIGAAQHLGCDNSQIMDALVPPLLLCLRFISCATVTHCLRHRLPLPFLFTAAHFPRIRRCAHALRVSPPFLLSGFGTCICPVQVSLFACAGEHEKRKERVAKTLPGGRGHSALITWFAALAPLLVCVHFRVFLSARGSAVLLLSGEISIVSISTANSVYSLPTRHCRQ